MRRTAFIITLSCLVALVSCNKGQTYTVDGVIEDINTCQNSEELKKMFNDPEFFKWLVDLPQGDQNRIEERMEYNFIRLQIGVDGIIKEINETTSLSELHWLIEDYNDKWVRFQPEEDQKRIADALFNKAIKFPADVNYIDFFQPIIIERLRYCSTPEEVENLMSNSDLENWVSQLPEKNKKEFAEPIVKTILALNF